MTERPVLLYDGDCGFCRYWIIRWQHMWKDSIQCFPYQEVLNRYPQVTQNQCQDAIQLLMPDGKVFSGAHAVFHGTALSHKYRGGLWMYERIPGFDRLSEAAYQWVAHHRFFLSRLFGSSNTCSR